MYSRFGRFLDSVGDFLVNLLVFAAIGFTVYRETGWTPVYLVAFVGFLGISLRVSYHVYYQTSFLHLRSAYDVNRVTEEIREEDLVGEPRALRMQRLFLFLYGWQDNLMVRLDRWSMRGVSTQRTEEWYGNRTALVLSGFLGIGTELFILMLFSLARRLDLYLWVNIVGLNGVWGICVLYRRGVLARRLRQAIPSNS